MTVVVNRLKRVGVLYNRDAKSFSKFLILKARESFRSDPPPNMQVREVWAGAQACMHSQ